jgi:hypothetical protein
MTTPQTGKLTGDLFNECAEWIWEQMQDDGFFLSGELVDLILLTERELGIHTRDLTELAALLDEEFKMRGVSADPYPLDPLMIQQVLQWEDDFLGFAGIQRAES